MHKFHVRIRATAGRSSHPKHGQRLVRILYQLHGVGFGPDHAVLHAVLDLLRRQKEKTSLIYENFK